MLLQRLKGRGAPSHQVARGRVGRPRRARQCGGADLCRHRPSMRSSRTIRRCMMPGSAARRWPGSGEVDEIASVVLVSGIRRRQPDDRKRRPRRWRLYLLVGGYICWQACADLNGTGMKQAFIGVDVGTSSARAGVFDEQGMLLATARHPITIWHEAGNVVEQSSSDIWAACVASVRVAMAEAALPACRRQRHRLRCNLLAGGARRRRRSADGQHIRRPTAQRHRLDGPSRDRRGPRWSTTPMTTCFATSAARFRRKWKFPSCCG